MNKEKIAIEILFTKVKDMVFISHLDLVRLFHRVFQRSRVKLFYTKGFNPRPKFSFSRALGLGKSSKKEKCTVYLTEKVDLVFLQKQLNQYLPQGIRVKKLNYK